MAKKHRRATEEERIQAVRRLENGENADEVAEMMEVGRRTLFDWLEKYRRKGEEGLSTKPTPGRPASLTDRQMDELTAIIEEIDPRQLGFSLALWTRGMVGDLIWERFKVKLTDVSVGRILHKLGMSPQRPLYRAYQQDPEKVEDWKENIYPEIRKEAKKSDALIFFADEASVRLNFHSGTT